MTHSASDLIISFPQAIGYCLTMVIGEMFLCSLYFATWDALRYLHRLHQVPCSRCIFFTGEYTLKCTVHPHKALTENAIHCCDFESVKPLVGATLCAQGCLYAPSILSASSEHL